VSGADTAARSAIYSTSNLGASIDAVNNALAALHETTGDLLARLSRESPGRSLTQTIPTPVKEIGRAMGDILVDRER
jgi:hypothetical protein